MCWNREHFKGARLHDERPQRRCATSGMADGEIVRSVRIAAYGQVERTYFRRVTQLIDRRQLVSFKRATRCLHRMLKHTLRSARSKPRAGFTFWRLERR